jgi:hypothetical protein
MKRTAAGRVDLSLGGLIAAPRTKPSTSQLAVATIQANREAEVSRAVETNSPDLRPVTAARFEGLDPFTRELIETNPLAPRPRPKAESPKPKVEGLKLKAESPRPRAEEPGDQKGGSLDGLFMMLGAALATGAGGIALAKSRPAQPNLARVPAAQPGLTGSARASQSEDMTSPAAAYHIPTR